MAIDLWMLALLVLFTLAGHSSGAVRQISHWIGLAAAFLFAKPAATLLSPTVAARMNWPPTFAAKILHVVLLLVILLTVGMAARAVLNALEPGEERGPLDQSLGAVVGAAKGGLIVFALLCLGVSLEKTLARMHFDLEAKTRGSVAMAFARKHNLFAHANLPPLEALKTLSDQSLKIENPDIVRKLKPH